MHKEALNARFESWLFFFEFFSDLRSFLQKIAFFDIEKVKLFKSAKVCEVGLYMTKKRGSVQSLWSLLD